MVLAVVVSFFIPKKYVSFGVIYPTNSNSIEAIVKNPDVGFEVQADRLIQLLDSKAMRDHVIDKFNLINYYELDTSNPAWHGKLIENYSDDISFSRTPYLSVVIRAELKDPELCAAVVNDIIGYIDTLRKDLYQENIIRLNDDYRVKLALQEEKVKEALMTIDQLDGPKQPNDLSRKRLVQLEERERNGESLDGDGIIKSKLQLSPSYQLESAIDNYYFELGVYNEMKSAAIETSNALELPFPNVYVISSGEVDRKKVSPSYSTNGVLGLLVGLFFSIAYFFLKDRWSEIKAKIQ